MKKDGGTERLYSYRKKKKEKNLVKRANGVKNIRKRDEING